MELSRSPLLLVLLVLNLILVRGVSESNALENGAVFTESFFQNLSPEYQHQESFVSGGVDCNVAGGSICRNDYFPLLNDTSSSYCALEMGCVEMAFDEPSLVDIDMELKHDQVEVDAVSQENKTSANDTVLQSTTPTPKERPKLVVLSPDEFKKQMLDKHETKKQSISASKKNSSHVESETPGSDAHATNHSKEVETSAENITSTSSESNNEAILKSNHTVIDDESPEAIEKRITLENTSVEKVVVEESATTNSETEQENSEFPEVEESEKTIAEIENELEEDEIEDDEEEKGSNRDRFNYASIDAGAMIMSTSDKAKGASNLLYEDKDKYALFPAESRKWIIVILSEEVTVDSIVLANYERYSSTIKKFQLLGSHKYPCKDWMLLGEFQAENILGEQVFKLERPATVRYLKLRFVSFYNDEFYVTLSLFRVYGLNMAETLRTTLLESEEEVSSLRQTINSLSFDGEAEIGEPVEVDTAVPAVAEEETVVEQVEREKASESQDESVDVPDTTTDNRTVGVDNSIPTSNDTVTEAKVVALETAENTTSTSVNATEISATNESNKTVTDEQPVKSTSSEKSELIQNVTVSKSDVTEASISSLPTNATQVDGNKIIVKTGDTLVASVASLRRFNKTDAKPLTWISGLHVTKLSSCPEGYTIVNVDMNPKTSTHSYLCFRGGSLKDSSDVDAIDEVRLVTVKPNSGVEKDKACGADYTLAGSVGSTNGDTVYLCYHKVRQLTTDTIETIDVRTCGKESEGCLFIEALNVFFCTGHCTDCECPEVNTAAEDTANITVVAAEVNKNKTVAENRTVSSSNITSSSSATSATTTTASESSKGKSSSSRSSKDKAPSGTSAIVENIFKTLTQKIQELEIDQSLFKRYLEDLNVKYSAVVEDVHNDLEVATTDRSSITSNVEMLRSDVNALIEENKKYADVVARLDKEMMRLTRRVLVAEDTIADLVSLLLFVTGLVAMRALSHSFIMAYSFISFVVSTCIKPRPRSSKYRKSSNSVPNLQITSPVNSRRSRPFSRSFG